jgi:hypothetical protein
VNFARASGVVATRHHCCRSNLAGVTSLTEKIPKGSPRAIDLVLGAVILGILAAVSVTGAILVIVHAV